jgi:hypothetical protein
MSDVSASIRCAKEKRRRTIRGCSARSAGEIVKSGSSTRERSEALDDGLVVRLLVGAAGRIA